MAVSKRPRPQPPRFDADRTSSQFVPITSWLPSVALVWAQTAIAGGLVNPNLPSSDNGVNLAKP